MRSLVMAVSVFGMVSAAQAADMPDLPVLRGGLTEGLNGARANWDGYYVGGQFGYGTSDMDFSGGQRALTNYIFRNTELQSPTSNWSVLNKQHVQGSSFGAFVGRNWQWDDAVFGLEVNYNYMNRMAGASSGTLGPILVPASGAPQNHVYNYSTTISAGSALTIKDVVTLRGRVGWAADNFLPYVFGGLAVGRMEVSRFATTNVQLRDDYTQTVTITGLGTVTNTTTTYSPLAGVSKTYGESRTNSFVGGWTGGLGFEYMMWGGLFARGEWEYVKFMTVKDTAVTLNSFRAGVGYKF
ncbi:MULTISPECIES: outer membrane protein [Bradyrhizobium]|jgi:outer membrane immunogenic protein|uniref:Outer membrane beta-barrel protein n=2 Tax=Bradyrhizobium TaxID=374 RepID=A0ABS5GGM6_9BRAD|nr:MULTISPECIES: outer membrane beta-barrel protein [Bradyrhizobium]MBR1140290.1 outer membrane beta-barrel protein [Bradyrhizobium denitrificans]MCL8486170.1 outer membrane beta-barrel protein [Bradyrhizobium denitrificans]MDU1496749.1 outer membrane beta-barrel protein [Bradyrhizobium sp.]MDU1547419.1 outer membrane beta-barrel protein [Bradyrhizobium sp.]MDU1667108.1 outer membrane beta-barrel protein [Bradyrhizobium sp.]